MAWYLLNDSQKKEVYAQLRELAIGLRLLVSGLFRAEWGYLTSRIHETRASGACPVMGELIAV